MPRQTVRKHLSLQQKRRLESLHEERLERRLEQGHEAAAVLVESVLGEPEEGLVITHFGLNVELESAHGERLRCAVRETTAEEPVCGDRVLWRRASNGQGVIDTVLPRHGVLRRPGPFGRLLTAAANVDRLVVTVAALQPNLGLLDRTLVAAEVAGIEPLILFNKVDLAADRATLARQAAPYRAMDYAVLMVSALTGEGLAALEQALRQGVNAFVGQSGVGKSSLIARWTPNEAVRVAAVNQSTGRGRHTTTVARLYPLPGGGKLIDSPGVRAFGLHGVTAAEVPRTFRDIAPYLNQCRFSDCSHRHEPNCAVRTAAAQGLIAPARLASLHNILDSLG